MGLLPGNRELFWALAPWCRQPIIDGSRHVGTGDGGHEVNPTLVIGTSCKVCVDSLLIATAIKLWFDFFFFSLSWEDWNAGKGRDGTCSAPIMECILLSVLQDTETVADMADFPDIHFSSSRVGMKLNFIFSSLSYYTYSHREKFSLTKIGVGGRHAT